MFAAMLLLTGCNVEETLIESEVPVEKGKLSFILPLGGKKTVTYAQTVPGTDAEYDVSRLAIFWFKNGSSSSPATDILYKRFSYGTGTALGNSLSLSQNPTLGDNTATATIDVGEDDFASKFYIVANVNAAGSVASKALSDVIPGTTTRAQFEKLLTDSLLDDSSDGEVIVPVSCPLPMSINSASSPGGYIELTSLVGQTPSAHLKRRVARFDVINNADYTNFTIEKVYVSRAPRRGYIQDFGFDGSATVWKSDSVGKFVVLDSLAKGAPATSPNLNGTRCQDRSKDANNNGIPDEFEGATKTRDSLQKSGPAFYLYPTQIDQAHTKTEIVLEGKYSNVERIYRLTLPSGTSEIDIEANKVYHIKVKRAESHEVEIGLTVEHWDDGDTHEWNGNDKSAVYGDITAEDDGVKTTLSLPAGASAYAPAYEYSSKDSVTLKFSVTGTAKDPLLGGVAALISFEAKPGTKYVQSDLDAIQNTAIISANTEVTYSSQYRTDYVIKLPPTNAPLETALKISNAANPNDDQVTLALKSNNYAKTGFKPVLVTYTDDNPTSGTSHTVLWAPVNVGATEFNETAHGSTFSANADGEKLAGNVFQWGRNVPFQAYTNYSNVVSGPVDSTTAAGTTNFITINNYNVNDWRDTRNDDLWGAVSGDAAKMRGPCPEGWSVPTKEQIQAIIDNASRTNSGNYAVYTFPAINGGGVLAIPVCGYRVYDGSYPTSGQGIGANGDYWIANTGTTTATRGLAFRVQGNAGIAILLEEYTRAYAFFIRAVRELD
jgi:hypothetical protein